MTAAELAREQVIEDRKFGKRPIRTKVSTTQGLVYDETYNPQTGMWERGDDYDPKIRSVEAQKQFVEGKKAGRVTYQTVIRDGKPVQLSSRGKVSALPKPHVSKAQEYIDIEFGKLYAANIAGGQIHDSLSQLEKLESVAKQLDDVVAGVKVAGIGGEPPAVQNLTGPVIGLRPRWSDAMINPAQLAAQETVEEVVQRNLRLVLGAQFTQKEGERLIARAYNPQLEEAENAVRVRRLLNAMRSTLNAQLEAARYFEENDTLQGWKGTRTTLSLADLHRIVEGSDTLRTGEGGNVEYPDVNTPDQSRREGTPLNPEEQERLKELRRKARGR